MADWDPLSATSTGGTPSKTALHRARADFRRLCEEPLEGIVVSPDAKDPLRFHALLSGPAGTPYEGGSFYFVLRLPNDYPHSPPRARIMTTGGGAVRFNPNLYANGKVCLSILGTWQGPGWSPAQNLSSVLLSVQSLMGERPYSNEPGHEVARSEKDVGDLNDILVHETLRVACLGNVRLRPQEEARAAAALAGRRGGAGGGAGGGGGGAGAGVAAAGGGSSSSSAAAAPSGAAARAAAAAAAAAALPDDLLAAARESFLAQQEALLARCDSFAGRLDGAAFRDPFDEQRGAFAFRELRRALAVAAEGLGALGGAGAGAGAEGEDGAVV